MRDISVEQIALRLRDEFGYAAREAEMLAQDLMALEGSVRDAFAYWWQTGEIQPLDVQGYSVERLEREYDMNVIAAFLTLEWLLEDPEIALQAISEGYDQIDVGAGSNS